MKYQPYNPEGPIERLTAEAKLSNDQLEEIRRILRSHHHFDGLTAVGGVKALLKAYVDVCNELNALKTKYERETKKKP